MNGVLERKPPREQRTHIDASRRQILDGPIEFDAPAERALEVELLHHDLVHDERKRLVRQCPDLHDGAASLGGRHAALQRSQASRSLESDVELGYRKELRVAIGAEPA